MIGQNGLPMMNNMAGSKEKTPDELQAKSAASEAATLERASSPDRQAFTDALDAATTADQQAELTKEVQGSSSSSAKLADEAIDDALSNSLKVSTTTTKPPTDVEASVTLDAFGPVSKSKTARFEAAVDGQNTRNATDIIGNALSTGPANDALGSGANVVENPGAKSATATGTRTGDLGELPSDQRFYPALQGFEPVGSVNQIDQIERTVVAQYQLNQSPPSTRTELTESTIQYSGPEVDEISSDHQVAKIDPGKPSLNLQATIDKAQPVQQTTSQQITSLQHVAPESAIASQAGNIDQRTPNLAIEAGLAQQVNTTQGTQVAKASTQLAVGQIAETSRQLASLQVNNAPSSPAPLTPEGNLHPTIAKVGVSSQAPQTLASPAVAPPSTPLKPSGDLLPANIRAGISMSADQSAISQPTSTAQILQQSLINAGSTPSLNGKNLLSNPVATSQTNFLNPTPAQILSGPNSPNTRLDAYSLPNLAGTSQTNDATLTQASQLSAAPSNPSPPNLGIMADNSFLALSALRETSEVSLGTSSVTASATPSRIDASLAPLPASSSAEARVIAQQISQAIIRMDGTRTEVLLDPAELGRVTLTFITKDEGLSVQINADRQETADLLRRNSEQLQRDLSGAGYEGVELDFGQANDDPSNPSKANRTQESGVAQSLSVSYSADFATSGLDIRI